MAAFELKREQLESGGEIVIVTINKPKQMNAMTFKDSCEAVKLFNQMATDTTIRALVLTGKGKAFSAGADLTVAAQIFQGTISPTDKVMDVVSAIENLPFPVIGAINGPAITGGFELALACDILIASPNALFVDTHAKFGIHPCWGLSQKLQRIIGANRARHYSLSAAPITAQQAEAWGLVSPLVPADQLLPSAITLARKIASNHPGMVNAYKSIINKGGELAYGASRDLERNVAKDYYGSMTKDDFLAMQKFLLSRRGKGKKKNQTKQSKL